LDLHGVVASKDPQKVPAVHTTKDLRVPAFKVAINDSKNLEPSLLLKGLKLLEGFKRVSFVVTL
jgi:hypothetical protein